MIDKNNILWERSKRVTPGGVHSPVRSFQSVGGTPVFFEKAKGAYLFDVNKKKYIDFCLSFGPLIHGHLHPKVYKVVKKAIQGAWSFGACEPYSLALAEWIKKQVPWIDKIRFVSSGTEAVMSVLRLARAFTNREGILKFEGCYHGHVDSLLVKSGSGLASSGEGDSAGLGSALIQNTHILPLDDEERLEKFFREHGSKLAATIIEPLPANYGLLIQRKAFWEKVSQLCKEYGVVLIFDEVISGFRVGLQGMAGVLGIKPDIVCFGKIIGGGFPVGAYGGREELMNMISPQGSVYQAGTLSANPVGMQAGLATLKICEETDNFYENLQKNTVYFCTELEVLLNRFTKMEWEVPNLSSIFWIRAKSKDLVVRSIKKIPEAHKENYAKIFHIFLKQGLYFAPSGYEVGFLSSAHTKAVIDDALNKVENAFKHK